MEESNVIAGETIIDENPELQKPVEPDTEIKNWLVEYVGEALQPENNEVTLEMVIEVMAKEFPEFLLSIAEENFIRGYQQALLDIEEGQKAWEEEKAKRKNNNE
jgi:hypothetical protein